MDLEAEELEEWDHFHSGEHEDYWTREDVIVKIIEYPDLWQTVIYKNIVEEISEDGGDYGLNSETKEDAFSALQTEVSRMNEDYFDSDRF